MNSNFTDYPKQEPPCDIFVCVLDETYDKQHLSEEIENREREEFINSISFEFKSEFIEVDIGPGASLPAFLTIISEHYILSILGATFGLFLSGKPILENLDAWSKLAKRVKKYFTREVYLNRNGASVIAIDALLNHLDILPEKVTLIGYSSAPMGESSFLIDLTILDEIKTSVDTQFIGAVTHIFDIEVNDNTFRVAVDGRNTQILDR